jgi:hypothetical protein
MGPAGLFAALLLAENGYAPILIDRGASVEERVADVAAFRETGRLNTESNIQFGAGGAGTFSDGKLVTRINDARCGFVLKTLRRFGAPEEILTRAKPHVGTDILREAESLAANSQMLGTGWRSFDNNSNRYSIINDYMNGTLSSFRQLQYDYHRKGLDDMATNVDCGRATITESLELLKATKQAKSTSILPVLFTEIKKDELINIYSKGLDKEKDNVVAILENINPSLSSDWNTIKTSK